MSVRVALVVEQMWQPVPGGSGRYIVEVASRLGAAGARALGIAAAHGRDEPSPASVGLTIPVVNSRLPRRLLYAAWDRAGAPGVDRLVAGPSGEADAVHATTWAIPPTSKPLAVTVHDVAFVRDPAHFTRHGNAYFRRALDKTRRRAGAIIVPSRATADDCVAAGLDAARITVIPHGLTHTPASADQVRAFQEAHGLTRPYILWVGTREPRKNLPTLLRAFARLAPASDLDLVLVGPAGWGEDATEEASLAEEIPAGRLHVLGRLGDADLAAAYVGGIMANNRYRAGEAGLLVDPVDAGALAEALAAAAGTDHDRLAAAGRERASLFTWEESARAHAAVYQDLVR